MTRLKLKPDVMVETHPGHWNDAMNDVFIDHKKTPAKWGGTDQFYVVSERLSSNRHQEWLKTKSFDEALALATRLSAGRSAV